MQRRKGDVAMAALGFRFASLRRGLALEATTDCSDHTAISNLVVCVPSGPTLVGQMVGYDA